MILPYGGKGKFLINGRLCGEEMNQGHRLTVKRQ